MMAAILLTVTVVVLHDFVSDFLSKNSASNGQKGNHAFPLGLGLRANLGTAVLMTVAQRPNVSQRGREKLARLGSLDLAAEFSMWSGSKLPAIGGLHTISSAFVDLLQP